MVLGSSPVAVTFNIMLQILLFYQKQNEFGFIIILGHKISGFRKLVVNKWFSRKICD